MLVYEMVYMKNGTNFVLADLSGSAASFVLRGSSCPSNPLFHRVIQAVLTTTLAQWVQSHRSGLLESELLTSELLTW
jgi:hypothetical protein